MKRYSILGLIAVLMTACGGGSSGGASASSGSGSSSSSTGSTSNTLAFQQSPFTFSYPEGTSQSEGFSFTPDNPSEFEITPSAYIQAVDQQGLFQLGGPAVGGLLDPLSGYLVPMTTSSVLPAGTYQGNFLVYACTDSTCVTQLPGSPWSLPYNVQVTKSVLQVTTQSQTTLNSSSSNVMSPMNFLVQGTPLSWNVTTDVSWLQVNYLSSAVGQGTFSVTVPQGAGGAYFAGMTIGTYTGHVTVTSADGQTVVTTITAVIQPQFALGITSPVPAVVAMNSGGALPASIVFSVGSPASWKATANASWMSITNVEVATGTFNLNFPVNSLAPGSYSGYIVVNSSDGQSVTSPVSLTVYSATLPILEPYAGFVVNGYGASASIFTLPQAVATDSAGNVYVINADAISKITPGGAVATLADGFNKPLGLAIDSADNVYVADTNNDLIRVITPSGYASTVAGALGVAGSTDSANGGSAARFSSPQGIARDGAGSIYVADTGNSTIRKITHAGVVSTLAGTAGQAGSMDGTGAAARFNNPQGIAIDSAGNLYVADTGNNTIRKITPVGVVSTIAGPAGFSSPRG